MSRKGNCWDNVDMGSFFARMKVDLIYPEDYRTMEALCAGLFEYTEIFYNWRRQHSSVSYVGPATYVNRSNPMNLSAFRG